MRRPNRPSLATVLAAMIVLLAPAAALAAEWPQYQSDAAHTGAADGPLPPYGVAWTTPVEAAGPQDRFGLSAPIVADGLVVAVGPVSIEAFDAATGAAAWSLDRVLGPSVPAAIAATDDGPILLYTEGWGAGPEPLAGSSPTTPTSAPSSSPGSPTPATGSPSPSAGPSVGEGFVGPSRLVAVTWPSGEPAWSVDLPQVSRTGVTVAEGLAFVGTNDGTVTAVDVATGEVRWSTDAGRNVEHEIAVADGVVVVPVRGGDRTPASVVGLGLDDGVEAWRFEPEAPALVVSPAAIADGSAFVGLSDGSIHAFRIEDGTAIWSARVNGAAPWAPPAVAGGRVFVVNLAGQMYAFDGATGTRVWDHARNVGVYRPAPVLVGDAVLMGTVEGQVVAFDADGGDAVWHLDLGTGSIHAFAATGDAVFVVRGGTDAGVLALTHDDAGTTVDEQSPTIVEPVRIAGNWALAAVPIGVVLVFLGRVLATRMGPPDLSGPPDENDEDAA